MKPFWTLPADTQPTTSTSCIHLQVLVGNRSCQVAFIWGERSWHIPLSWWKNKQKTKLFELRSHDFRAVIHLKKTRHWRLARSWTKWSSEPIFPQAWTPSTKHLRNLPSNNSWAVIIPGHLPSCAEGDGSFWFSLSSMASSGKVKLFFIEVYPWDQASDRMAFHQV